MADTNVREVKFTVKWELKDYVHFSFMHYLKTRQGKFYIFTTIIFIVFILFNLKGQNTFLNILLILGIMIMNPLAICLKAKKAFTDNKRMQKEQYYTVNDEGISIEVGSWSSTVKWGQISKVSESKRYTVVFVSASDAFIIPRKTFSDSMEKKELLDEIIRSNMSAA